MTQAETLNPDQCWELLERHELARLGYVLDGIVHVVPINYGVHQGSLIFATAPGSKLEAVLTGHDLTIEIDEVVDEVGRSVVARGRGAVVADQDQIEMTQVRVRPWVATGVDVPVRDTFVRVEPRELTGRVYPLRRPWKSMRR